MGPFGVYTMARLPNYFLIIPNMQFTFRGQILLNTTLIFYHTPTMFSEYQQSTQGLLLQKDEGFFLCALSDFYLYKMYLSLDHAVNQQFKVFLQTSLIFFTPNNSVPLANCLFLVLAN